MARRRRAPIRPIIPDPLFESEIVAKFTLRLMDSGKKKVAQRIMYGALDRVQATLLQNQKSVEAGQDDSSDGGEAGEGGKGKQASAKSIVALSRTHTVMTNAELRVFALKKFEEVLDKIGPFVEVKSRRVGGATYQVPVEVRPKRRMALAMRWLIQNAAARHEKNMILCLAYEMLDALEGRGGAVKQRENVHKMAKANQAFVHYGW